MSNPYYFSPYRAVALDSSKLENWEKSAKIAVAESEDGATDLPEKFGIKPEQMVKYKTVFLALSAVAKGEVDVAVNDATVSQFVLGGDAFQAMKDKFVAKNLKAGEGSKLVFAVQKGNDELVKKVNIGLANIQKSGEFDQIIKKYHQNPELIKQELNSVATSATTAN